MNCICERRYCTRSDSGEREKEKSLRTVGDDQNDVQTPEIDIRKV